MLSALKGNGLVELQRELAALDRNPSAGGDAGSSMTSINGGNPSDRAGELNR